MWCLALSERSINLSYNYYKLPLKTTQAKQDTTLSLAPRVSVDPMTPAYLQPRDQSQNSLAFTPVPRMSSFS